MGRVIGINGKRLFSLEEARELLPVVRRVTETAFQEVEAMNTRLKYLEDMETITELETKIESVVQAWSEKIQKLGCDTKGIWLVDFDNGEGYYCWRYPEGNLDYFHSYLEGFQGRKVIEPN